MLFNVIYILVRRLQKSYLIQKMKAVLIFVGALKEPVLFKLKSSIKLKISIFTVAGYFGASDNLLSVTNLSLVNLKHFVKFQNVVMELL